MPNIGGWEIAIVLVLILIIFGPKKLPELGSSLGKSIRGFRKSLKEGKDEVQSTVTEVREAVGVDEMKSAVAEVREATAVNEIKSTVAEIKQAADVKSVLSTKPQVTEATATAESMAVAELELPAEPPSTSKWVDSE
jgi:sec-independent protein translocase protein TatA